MKKYVLPLSRDYVRHWGFVEAIRELVQNALDRGEWSHEFGDDSLNIYSPNGSLNAATLVLGTTSKFGDAHTIGSFGEGYKIALLVLTRLGFQVGVFNNGKLWEPGFAHDENFGCEVLTIEEQDWECKGLEFRIQGLKRKDIDSVIDSCLHMQDPFGDGDVIEVSQGRILLDRKGELFINGLWVGKTEGEYGYDVKPEFLALERDRQTVDGFKLQWLMKDMWCETKQWDRIAAMVAGEVYDVNYAHHKMIPELDKACLKVFDEQQSPTRTIAASPQEAAKSGGSYYSSNMYSMVSRVPAYQERVAKPLTPTDMLEAWLRANKKHMRRHAIKAFEDQLIKTHSKTWKMQ